jgi:hypothetical protein
MKKISIITALLIAIAGTYSCKKGNPVNIAATEEAVSILPADASWTLDPSKSDEFDNLNSDKWSAAPLWYYGGVSEALIYKAENSTVSGGVARLAAKKEEYNGMHYTAGCLKSKFEVGGNTYTEVRAKMVKTAANVCAAIWMGDDPVLAKNPNIEIDIQETKEPISHPNQVNTSLLTWPKPGNGNTVPGYKLYYISQNLDLDFHLYGLERRDGKLTLFLDGVKYWEWSAAQTPEFVTQMRPIILSLEGHAGTPVDAELPSDFQIDWVRVYNGN